MKNYRNATGKCILFPGCNFPSFYPKTMKELVKLLKEHGIGVAYDCCGKPIAELGLEVDEKRIIQRINDEFEKRGVEEVIMLCPNCYTFLKPYLKVKVTDIYAKLEGLGIGEKNLESGKVFLPCPDREKREILASAERFVKGSLESVKGVQCCCRSNARSWIKIWTLRSGTYGAEGYYECKTCRIFTEIPGKICCL